jgi:hypothetical protein
MRLPTADSERGSVAAEFAAVVPAVVVVLVACLAGFQMAGAQIRLQDAAAITARSLGRGATVSPPSLGPGFGAVSASRSSVGDLVCVRLESRAQLGAVLAMPISATSCALDGGH